MSKHGSRFCIFETRTNKKESCVFDLDNQGLRWWESRKLTYVIEKICILPPTVEVSKYSKNTVTVVNNGESVIWRRRHYLFTVVETGRGIIYGGVFFFSSLPEKTR